jgi:hypothetical protein
MYTHQPYQPAGSGGRTCKITRGSFFFSAPPNGTSSRGSISPRPDSDFDTPAEGARNVLVVLVPVPFADCCPDEDRLRPSFLPARAESGSSGAVQNSPCTRTSTHTRTDDGLEPNWRVLNYWAMRLRPLWANSKDVDAKTEVDEGMRQSDVNEQRDVIVVVCNRFGHERGAISVLEVSSHTRVHVHSSFFHIGKTFAGSSAMFSMPPGSGKPRLLHAMGEREEGVCVWTARVGSHRGRHPNPALLFFDHDRVFSRQRVD